MAGINDKVGLLKKCRQCTRTKPPVGVVVLVVAAAAAAAVVAVIVCALLCSKMVGVCALLCSKMVGVCALLCSKIPAKKNIPCTGRFCVGEESALNNQDASF